MRNGGTRLEPRGPDTPHAIPVVIVGTPNGRPCTRPCTPTAGRLKWTWLVFGVDTTPPQQSVSHTHVPHDYFCDNNKGRALYDSNFVFMINNCKWDMHNVKLSICKQLRDTHNTNILSLRVHTLTLDRTRSGRS